MAKYLTSETKPIYAAAERFVASALRKDDSLFTSGKPIWTSSVIADLFERFVLKPEESSESFLDKLRRQLDAAPPSTIQLAAETLYIYYLIAAGIHGKTKRDAIKTVLGWLPEPVTIPPDLDQALDSGLANPGTAFKTLQFFQIRFLLEFARAWKQLEPSDRDQRLTDPWTFKDFLFSLPIESAYTEREALLHLVHPDTFERVISKNVKSKIAQRLGYLVSESGEDVDRQLAEIRAKLTQTYGSSLDFYQDDVMQLWSRDSTPWDEFIKWAHRFYEWEGFDKEERDYKLDIVNNLQAVREAVLLDGPHWFDRLKRAFLPPNNLTGWRIHQPFLDWCQAEPVRGVFALKQIWDPSATFVERIDRFLESVPESCRQTRGASLALAVFLHMAMDPLRFPMYRATPLDRAYRLTDYESDRSISADGLGSAYEHVLGFFDKVINEAAIRGLKLRDRLDAQGLTWCVTSWDPRDEWSDSDRQAFLAYRNGKLKSVRPDSSVEEDEGEGPGVQPTTLDNLAALADRLLIDEPWFREIEALLRDKRQIIFSGPPGTGKTFVARELATCLSGSDERVTLVQFHPSYAYEDFVEGYRPASVDGQPFFRLVSGPLKHLALKAQEDPEHPYVLIIDEINRGNIAKVFGELYFLLEYRDQPIRLQYSQEPFSLPDNLWIIGTMNTADRSIALIDAALRRRFYFVDFSPNGAPVQGLLRRWLEREKPELVWVADRVDEANRRLNNDHVAIGPSYFMKRNLNDEWVARIWRHAILPYLAEQFFGEDERLQDFSLAALDGVGAVTAMGGDGDAPVDAP